MAPTGRVELYVQAKEHPTTTEEGGLRGSYFAAWGLHGVYRLANLCNVSSQCRGIVLTRALAEGLALLLMLDYHEHCQSVSVFGGEMFSFVSSLFFCFSMTGRREYPERLRGKTG